MPFSTGTAQPPAGNGLGKQDTRKEPKEDKSKEEYWKEPATMGNNLETLPSLAPKDPTVLGADGKRRPEWVRTNRGLVEYYDSEWGDPITDEHALFELLSLLTFQAGLRWSSVIARREALREALADFDPDVLATWGEEELEGLLENEKVIRNRRKLSAVLQNAAATVRLRERGGLPTLVWSFQPEKCPEFSKSGELPKDTEESRQLSAAMRERGFASVGPISCFALMQSAGVVDANPPGAHKYRSSGLWDEEGNKVRSPLAA